MSACLRCGLVLVVFVWAAFQPARSLAQDDVAADTMGRFLGFTVMCDCLSEDPEHLQALYYALLVEWGEIPYADEASGYIRNVVRNEGRYQGEDTLCWDICNSDFTVFIDDTMTMIDMDTEPAAFRAHYNAAYERWFGDDGGATRDIYAHEPGVAVWANPFCKASPSSPECRRAGAEDD